MKKKLSIVIPSYKSSEKILGHLKNFKKDLQVIIIENSYDENLKQIIENKYKNTKVVLQKNVGYGNAINLGSKFVKTKYFFTMNPDTVIFKDTLILLLRGCKNIKKFGAISPNYKENKNKKYDSIIEEKKTLTGGAMLFQTSVFKKIGGFDKNIFLYYEDNDYFTKCRKMGLRLYQINNSYHFHEKKSSGSASFKTNKENKNFAGHSLRAGFATVAAESGADERSIMAMTGHKTTQMVRRYIREANIFKNNALNKIKI